MNTVQDEVERRLRDRPEFERFFVEDRLNGFFVKNLENVQGDERDVMIFSVGYGYDGEGRMTLNFGPLNKPGGERRLNVAITRAREKVILVSSIKSSDINVDGTKASGVRHLYHYLRYAEKGPETSSPWATGDEEYGSPLELDVAEEVKRLGYEVAPRIGHSSFRVDIAVSVPEDPNRFILGILCDGETYRSANTARDRDRLRQQVLERLGWRIHRVWSPDWVQRRETEIRRLRKALREAEQSVGRSYLRRSDKKSLNRRPRREIRQIKVVETRGDGLPGVEPYHIADLKPRHSFEKYSPRHKARYLQQYRSEATRLLPKLVKEEGPIHAEHAYRQLNAALRLGQSTPFKKVFGETVQECHKKRRIAVKGDFLWPKSAIGLKVRVPVDGVEGTFRPIGHIPQEEIKRAMVLVAGHSLGLGVESLLKETARLLGFKRLGNTIRTILQEVYETLTEEGTLIQKKTKTLT
jgi:hypothetical protein